jgi:hypothetical protein
MEQGQSVLENYIQKALHEAAEMGRFSGFHNGKRAALVFMLDWLGDKDTQPIITRGEVYEVLKRAINEVQPDVVPEPCEGLV